MGGELTYRCLGGMNYEVSLVLYRDCAGIPVATNENLVITSANCAQTLNVSLSVTDTVTITSGCTSIPTWCNGGNAPGMQVYLYQDTVTLPMACTDWIMWNSNCCRNGSIQNLMNPSSLSSYFEARLDNVNAPCNSAPVYQELQMPFVCNNVMFCLDNGTYDPDGDSLVYSMTPAYNGNINNPIAYNPGYSVADPFPSAGGHAFDPVTGNHCAVPNQVGAYVVAYKIDEYRNGTWIGSTSREIQLWVVAVSIGDPGLCRNRDGLHRHPGFLRRCAALGVWIEQHELDLDIQHHRQRLGPIQLRESAERTVSDPCDP